MEISSVSWDVELAFWTLKHILPDNYPKLNYSSILDSSADYIEKLVDKLQTIRCRSIPANDELQPNSEGYSTDKTTFQISDEDEIELLSKLGLKKSDDKFVGAKPEWVDSIYIKQECIVVDNDEKCPYINAPKMQSSKPKVKRPGNGFIRFSTEKRKEILQLHPHSDNRQVSKILGIMWRKLTPEEKKPYIDQFVEHINVIRKAHPDWNYAASRAKSNAPSNNKISILEQRLRIRKFLPKYVQQEETCATARKQMPKHKPKSKSKKNNRKTSIEENIVWTNCDMCHKWRKMPSGLNVESLPFSWICSMNTDPMYNSCDKDQEVE